MWNARLDESQAGIKIAGRNINNLRYADDTTLMVRKSEEELKILLMRVKEENVKVDLKLNIHKRKIMASNPITACQIDGEKRWEQWQTFFSWAPKSLKSSDCSHEIKRRLLRRLRFYFRARKIPWIKAWRSTLVFLSGEFHGQRSLVGYSSWCHKIVGQDLTTK